MLHAHFHGPFIIWLLTTSPASFPATPTHSSNTKSHPTHIKLLISISSHLLVPLPRIPLSPVSGAVSTFSPKLQLISLWFFSRSLTRDPCTDSPQPVPVALRCISASRLNLTIFVFLTSTTEHALRNVWWLNQGQLKHLWKCSLVQNRL